MSSSGYTDSNGDKHYVTGCSEGGYYSTMTEHSNGSTSYGWDNSSSSLSVSETRDVNGNHTGSSISLSTDTGQSVNIFSSGK
jgi:hypothetical protein